MKCENNIIYFIMSCLFMLAEPIVCSLFKTRLFTTVSFLNSVLFFCYCDQMIFRSLFFLSAGSYLDLKLANKQKLTFIKTNKK